MFDESFIGTADINHTMKLSLYDQFLIEDFDLFINLTDENYDCYRIGIWTYDYSWPCVFEEGSEYLRNTYFGQTLNLNQNFTQLIVIDNSKFPFIRGAN